MAFQVGTAANMEDMFSKLLSFVTANPTLVSLGQNWEVMRVRRDNLAELTSDLAQPGVGKSRSCLHTCRHDCRSVNYVLQTDYEACYNLIGGVPGSSYVRFRLREAREVKKVSLKCPMNTVWSARMIRNFRLQYSDDDVTWTTALTQTGVGTYAAGERKTFQVSVNPGAHIYWRIIIDSVSAGGYMAWSSMLLLQADDTVANQFGSEAILRGPGLGGTESIYVGIRSEYSASSGWYNLFLNGYTGYDPYEESWLLQPGCLLGTDVAPIGSQPPPMVPLWNNTMPYWLSASGRSIRLGVKVSTSYEGAYLGLILPYASPSQYPYPLFVGGSMVSIDSPGVSWRYDRSEYYHSLFFAPSSSSWAINTDVVPSTAYARDPAGVWRPFVNRPGNSNNPPNDTYDMTATSTNSSGPHRGMYPHASITSSGSRYAFRETLGDPTYVYMPVIPLQRLPTPMAYGELEGIYQVSGYNAAAEDTTNLAGKTVVTLQNAFRTLANEYWAISLE